MCVALMCHACVHVFTPGHVWPRAGVRLQHGTWNSRGLHTCGGWSDSCGGDLFQSIQSVTEENNPLHVEACCHSCQGRAAVREAPLPLLSSAVAKAGDSGMVASEGTRMRGALCCLLGSLPLFAHLKVLISPNKRCLF